MGGKSTLAAERRIHLTQICEDPPKEKDGNRSGIYDISVFRRRIPLDTGMERRGLGNEAT